MFQQNKYRLQNHSRQYLQYQLLERIQKYIQWKAVLQARVQEHLRDWKDRKDETQRTIGKTSLT
eukprot:6169132-Amphidinium_carterae.1